MKHLAIFLDIDGVLNSTNSPSHIWDSKEPIDQELVDNFLYIVEELKKDYVVAVVLSSAWRIGKTLEDVQDMMLKHGITIYSKTDYLEGMPRGYEIKKWMEDNTAFNHFVIFDDDIDMLGVEHFFVPVIAENGIQREHLRIARSIASRKYNVWRDMNYIVHSGEEVFLSNQPIEWIHASVGKPTGLILISLNGDELT